MSRDPLGRVVEVWEPDPAGTGSVFSPGGFQNFMSYNGSTVWVQQGQRGLSFHAMVSVASLSRCFLVETLQCRGRRTAKPAVMSSSSDRYSNLIRHTDAKRQGPLYVLQTTLFDVCSGSSGGL